VGRRYDTVSLLSDHGTVDESVGILRSVIRSIAPHATCIDLTHDVPPHDVRAGSLALVRAAEYLCPGVVLAAVDPGTGTSRRAIAVEVGDGSSVLVGPDNGLLAPTVSLCGGAGRVVQLLSEEHRLPSAAGTIDARDVLAPAAAHLCNGVDLEELGPLIDPVGLFPGSIPLTREEDGDLLVEVLWVDRFGNAQLNVDPDELAGWGERVTVVVDEVPRTARWARTYGELAPGQLGLVVDAYGLVSLAFDRQSAADELRIGSGSGLALRRQG
jgi:S-adenosylmethionine hydrolase